jgi:hypothetical protein
MSSEIHVHHARSWLIGGMAVMLGTAGMAAFLVTTNPAPLRSNRWQQAMLVLLIFMLTRAVEFPFREYIFRADTAAAWYFFRWHEVALPTRVVVNQLADGRLVLIDPTTGQQLLSVTREFTRGSALAEELTSFYGEHRGLAEDAPRI